MKHKGTPRFTYHHIHAAGVRIGTVDNACLPTDRETDANGKLDPFKCQTMAREVMRLATKAQRLQDEREGRKPRFIPRRIREGSEPTPVVEEIPRIPLPSPGEPTRSASYTRLDRQSLPKLHGPRPRGYVAKGGYTGLKTK